MEGIESAILEMKNRKSVEGGRASSPCRSHTFFSVGPEEEEKGFEEVLSELSVAANLNMEEEVGFGEQPGWRPVQEEADAAKEVEPENCRGNTTEIQNSAPSTGE